MKITDFQDCLIEHMAYDLTQPVDYLSVIVSYEGGKHLFYKELAINTGSRWLLEMNSRWYSLDLDWPAILVKEHHVISVIEALLLCPELIRLDIEGLKDGLYDRESL